MIDIDLVQSLIIFVLVLQVGYLTFRIRKLERDSKQK